MFWALIAIYVLLSLLACAMIWIGSLYSRIDGGKQSIEMLERQTVRLLGYIDELEDRIDRDCREINALKQRQKIVSLNKSNMTH